MVKKKFPEIHFYDQDCVDIYEKTWTWAQDFWQKGNKQNGHLNRFFNYPESDTINQFEAIFSTFFLVYSNTIYPAAPSLDNFYRKQEEDGAIRGRYSVSTGKPVTTEENPEGVMPPLFSWAEFNLYHKSGQKKRIKDIMPILERYYEWLENFKDENGLYAVPMEVTMMDNSPRQEARYFIDFNAQQAINALYMSALGEILNDKEISFKYKRNYFSLKTRINRLMWEEETGFYYDLDKDENRLSVKTIGGFWTLLAEIPNKNKADKLIAHLGRKGAFGSEHPFPTLANDEKEFDPSGNGFCGSVLPPFTFMVIKGLEKYDEYELAREASIRHIYFVLDVLHPEGKKKGTVWEAYAPEGEKAATHNSNANFPRPLFLPYIGLTTVTLMIENIVGLYISLPRKTVDWIIPTLEIMGIENLSLKRNLITILSNKSGRGWEIRMESEKLYYFTINILGKKKKTLPIPSGKCSMLIDKL